MLSNQHHPRLPSSFAVTIRLVITHTAVKGHKIDNKTC